MTPQAGFVKFRLNRRIPPSHRGILRDYMLERFHVAKALGRSKAFGVIIDFGEYNPKRDIARCCM